MITLIDYGAGNLHSLEGALDRLGLQHTRAERPDEAAPTGALVLPGVGHFHAAQVCGQAYGASARHFIKSILYHPPSYWGREFRYKRVLAVHAIAKWCLGPMRSWFMHKGA